MTKWEWLDVGFLSLSVVFNLMAMWQLRKTKRMLDQSCGERK